MSEPRKRDVVHEVVRLDDLLPVSRRPALADYASQLWERRHFIRADARGRVISGSRGTLLGLSWLVLRPVLDGLAYYVVFGLVLQTSRGIDNFLGYLIIGIFLFRFASRCISSGSQSLLSGRGLIRAFAFPRAALPLASTTRELFSALPMLFAMFALIIAIPPQEVITWRVVLFPLVFALQVLFTLGLAFLAARIVAHVPDVEQLISVLMRFWLYGSAVFFSYERYVDHPTLLKALEFNPMFIVLDISRDVLLYGVTPEPRSWLVLAAWTVASLAGGFVYFWRGEERYGSI